jgi:hypothetical protein
MQCNKNLIFQVNSRAAKYNRHPPRLSSKQHPTRGLPDEKITTMCRRTHFWYRWNCHRKRTNHQNQCDRESPSRFLQPKNQPVSVAENSSAKAEAGSFNAVSSDHLAGMIGTNLSAMKSAYHKTAANVPALPMPETGMLGLLVIGFVALQSIGRKEKAGATKLQ